MDTNSASTSLLQQMQATLQDIQQDYHRLSGTVKDIESKINDLTALKEIQNTSSETQLNWHRITTELVASTARHASSDVSAAKALSSPHDALETHRETAEGSLAVVPSHRSISTSRIILTTYPGQSGIDPLQMCWGHKDPISRGPVVVSRSHSTIRRRNGKRIDSQISVHRLTRS